MKHPIHHSFTDHGSKVGMQTLDAELKWSGVHAVRETPTMFLFYYHNRTAYFLPKRAVGSETESGSLAAWIQEQLPAETPYFHPDRGS